MQIILRNNKQQVVEALVAADLVTDETIDVAQQQAKESGEDLFEYLVSQDVMDEEDLVKIVAQVAGTQYVNLTDVSYIDPKTLDLIPFNIAQEYKAICLGSSKGILVVGMVGADDLSQVNLLSQVLKYPIQAMLASNKGINRWLGRYEVKIDSSSIHDMLDQQDDEKTQAGEKSSKTSILQRINNPNKSATDIEVVARESPATKALSNILKYAVVQGCSDVHIEALEDAVCVRVRADGVLKSVMKLDKRLEAGIMAKLKIETKLKVDEKRRPQDGEFSVSFNKRHVDLRVAITPTIFGEQAVLRILDQSGLKIGLESLGYCGQALKDIRQALKQSSGMILTSGPTGSGKTTTLYTLLQEVHSEKVKIITLEDPAEYKMEGINQIQINTGIGMTFAAGLRSVLRADPDIIMVGEIRDQETALLAVQAALTGHLVFSTVHTNSAAGILPRLLDMGVEPFLIASTIRLVIGQRLIRRLVDDENDYDSSPEETANIKKTLTGVLPSNTDSPEIIKKASERAGYDHLPFIEDPSYKLYRSTQGGHESSEAYQGRMGLYEAFAVSETIQKLIIDRATSSTIQRAAQSAGMITMRQDGYLKALAGRTTILEVDRVVSANSV